MSTERSFGYKVLMGVAIALVPFLLLGQSFALINYDFVVSIGLQESAEEVTTLGIAWAKAFGLGDTLGYIPFLIAGIIGMIKRKRWGFFSLFASLAVSVYWPIVNLSAIYIGEADMALPSEKYISFSIILPLISIYGLWGMWYLYRNHELLGGN